MERKNSKNHYSITNSNPQPVVPKTFHRLLAMQHFGGVGAQHPQTLQQDEKDGQ